jgi:hypothetical protein
MILDTQTRFSSAQSIAAAAGDVASTDQYDTGSVADTGIGNDLLLQIMTVAAVTSAGAATVQFVLQTSDSSTFASGNVEFPLTAALALAALTANTIQYRGRPPVGLKRYLRVLYRIGTATTTGGTATAFLVNDLQAAPAVATTVPGVK